MKYTKDYFRKVIGYSRLILLPNNMAELYVNFIKNDTKIEKRKITFFNVNFVHYSNVDLDLIDNHNITEVIDCDLELFNMAKTDVHKFLKGKVSKDFYLLSFHSNIQLSIGFTDVDIK